MALSIYPPPLPRRSTMYFFAPSFRRLFSDEINSWKVFLLNLFTLIYPTVGAIIYDASTECTGISPRMMSNEIGFDELLRLMPNVTLVSFFPFNNDITFSVDMDTPATFVPSTDIMRSPANKPIFSLGPPERTSIMVMVSFMIENEMPTPQKEPSNSSLVA